ncbi:PREDICTED: vegetative cell wall protein gp1-like [Dipodomys ordii]|uniref:Vegetative cell wall protein gp1-like n=1 Tax=Dipodomys ordii TaxID=10020 RepID=A0A1S3FZF7_DIPOR|nr:PREDICTED: vegetative cell wall protein gp1-like [Dipodomys ordii]
MSQNPQRRAPSPLPWKRTSIKPPRPSTHTPRTPHPAPRTPHPDSAPRPLPHPSASRCRSGRPGRARTRQALRRPPAAPQFLVEATVRGPAKPPLPRTPAVAHAHRPGHRMTRTTPGHTRRPGPGRCRASSQTLTRRSRLPWPPPRPHARRLLPRGGPGRCSFPARPPSGARRAKPRSGVSRRRRRHRRRRRPLHFTSLPPPSMRPSHRGPPRISWIRSR